MIDKKRGGRRNEAAAANGKRVGRPPLPPKPTFAPGDYVVIERESVGELNPFHKPELGRILNVSEGEIELQIGNDIVTVRRPDPDELQVK